MRFVGLHVTFLFLCAAGISGCAQRRQADLARAHAAVMRTLPAVVASLPVTIVPSFDHPVLAWATSGMMERHVSYNPRIADMLPTDVLAFALVHEYAHLQLDHIAFLSFATQPAAELKRQELEADRFASRFWATHNPRVARAAAAAFLSPGGHPALATEERQRQAGYPTRTERAQAILECLAQ